MTMAEAPELDPRKLDTKQLVQFVSELLRELDKRLSNAINYLDSSEYSNCWIQVTWVYNKLKRKYYYPYLKCRDGRSIYLRNKSWLEHEITHKKAVKELVREARDLHAWLIPSLLAKLGTANEIVEFAKTLREEVEELKKIEREERRLSKTEKKKLKKIHALLG